MHKISVQVIDMLLEMLLEMSYQCKLVKIYQNQIPMFKKTTYKIQFIVPIFSVIRLVNDIFEHLLYYLTRKEIYD